MHLFTFIGSIIGTLGGICGIVSLIYQRRQTWIMQQRWEDARRGESGYVNWAKKYYRASTALIKIYSKAIYNGPSPVGGRYLVFPGRELRKRIERHLRKGWFGFKPVALSREQLGNPVIQQLIDGALESIDKFKQEHPDWARSIGLLP